MQRGQVVHLGQPQYVLILSSAPAVYGSPQRSWRRLCTKYRFYLCVRVCVCQQDYWKSNQPISLKLGVTIEPNKGKNRLTFGGSPRSDTDSGSLTTFLGITEYGILEDLLAFLIQSPAAFHKTR